MMANADHVFHDRVRWFLDHWSPSVGHEEKTDFAADFAVVCRQLHQMAYVEASELYGKQIRAITDAAFNLTYKSGIIPLDVKMP